MGKQVSWIRKALCYTGNHDWKLEGERDWEGFQLSIVQCSCCRVRGVAKGFGLYQFPEQGGTQTI